MNLAGKTQQSNIVQRIEAFRNYLHTIGLHCTPERIEILQKAQEMPKHFDAKQLINALEQDSYHVSKATVYKTLELLCNCGLMACHHIEGRSAEYELKNIDHIHLVCTKCGKIDEFQNDAVTNLLTKSMPENFNMIQCSIYAYGLCKECHEHQTKNN